MLLKTLKKQAFFPGFLGLFTNPFYFARKGLYKHIQELAPQVKGTLLDVGCGQKPYRRLFNVNKYVGLEYDTPQNRQSKKADHFYDGHTFPFQNDSFDNVISNQVLEHVFTPDQFLSEINRVLKKEGLFLLTVPFVWDEHEQPLDFARYSSFGLKYILENKGFEIIESRKSVDTIAVIFQLANDYLYKTIVTRNTRLRRMLACLASIPCNLIGAILEKTLPPNKDLYLDNIVLARKIKDV